MLEDPTQVLYPIKAVLRTIVAALLGVVVTALIATFPGLTDLVNEVVPNLTTLLTELLFIIITGFFTWVMALPAVNAFLTKIGLGATPRG